MAKGRKSFKLDWFGDDLTRAVDSAGEPALWAAGQVLKREARERAPVKTGEMRNSMYVETTQRTDYRKGKRDRRYGRLRPKSEKIVLVAAAAWYSNLLEDSGAVAHVIPRKRRNGQKVLYIPGIGYRTSANHPGMKRKPFLSEALEANRERIGQEVAKVVKAKIDG